MLKLHDKYKKEAIPCLKERFGYKNVMACPKLKKVIINSGIGRISKEESITDNIQKDLALITGQRPVKILAKKSIASFKIRKGMPSGIKVTLRGGKMYDFLDRLIHIALPRSRDFRGLSNKNIDASGNLNIGIKEHIIFPEVSSDDVKNIFSFEVSVVTTAKNREEAVELLRLLGFPLKD